MAAASYIRKFRARAVAREGTSFFPVFRANRLLRWFARKYAQIPLPRSRGIQEVSSCREGAVTSQRLQAMPQQAVRRSMSSHSRHSRDASSWTETDHRISSFLGQLSCRTPDMRRGLSRARLNQIEQGGWNGAAVEALTEAEWTACLDLQVSN